MIQRFIALLLFVHCFVPLFSQGGKVLVMATSGGTTFIPLNKIVSIGYDDNIMKVNGADGTFYSNDIGNVDKMFFGIVGDVNIDSVVDVADVTKVVAMILDYSTATSAGDVDGDGTVDVADVTNVVNIILGNTDSVASVTTTVVNDAGDTSIAHAVNGIEFNMNSGEVRSVALSRIGSISFDSSQEYLYLTFADKRDSLLINDVNSIMYGELSSAVMVNYSGEYATVENPFAFDGVGVEITGAKLVVRSTIDSDVDYILSGESDCGNFKIYGTKKYTLRLDGLSLTNNDGAAINSQCKKRAKVIMEEGTVNYLCDAAQYVTPAAEDEKATLFSEGQLVFEGAGQLIVSGNYKHAICSDDYIAFRSGNIEVMSAASDAVHCNDSIMVSGGNITLAASGDGMDCDGYVTISGGDISMELTGEDKKGIKALGEINIIDGALSIISSGDISKGLKGSRNITISGGTVDISVSGNSILEAGEPSYCTGIKCDSLFTLSGGTLDIDATGTASRGISADGNIDITGGVCNVACSGGYEIYDPSAVEGDAGEEIKSSYIVYVSKPSTSTGSNRPGFSSSSWNNIYLYNSSNSLVATLTNSVTVNGTQFYYYDFGAETGDTYYFKSDNSRNYTIQSTSFDGVTGDVYYMISSTSTTSGNIKTYSLTDVTSSYAGASSSVGSSTEKAFAAACIKSDSVITLSGGVHTLSTSGNASKAIKSEGDCVISGGEIDITTTGSAAIVAYDPVYCTAIKCDADFIMSNGSVTINATGQGGLGISADGMLTIAGGEVNATIGGAGSSYTASTGTDYYSTKALKSDGAMSLAGGTIVCTATANGGKCIVADGLLTIGEEGRNDGYPYITAITKGASLGANSSFMGGGPGGNEGFNAAPKAIKGSADVVVYSGNIYASTTADGGEGLESKATLTINGGNIECATYDDAINAATALVFNGGCVYAHATNNDAIDSNGTIAINGGIVLASGSSQPEGGFDCDNNSFTITGGVILGTGGAASSPTSSSQYYSSLSSVTVSQGKYLVFKNAAGDVLFSYRCPNSVSGASVLVSSPQFTAAAHSMLYGVTSVSSPTESHFDGTFIIGGTPTGGTTKSFTPSTR